MRLTIIHPKVLGVDSLTPKIGSKGIAGAEETLLNVTYEFAKQGIDVDVYTQTREIYTPNTHINWKPLSLIEERKNTDCIIYWTDNIENLKKIQNYEMPSAKQECVRLVNQNIGKNINEVLNNGRRIGLSQSDWFLNHDPSLGTFQTYRWNNGIHPHRFSKARVIEKRKSKIFWGSDYDRGLMYILENWKDFRKIDPELNLTICYGWEIFNAKMENYNPSAKSNMMKFKDHLSSLMKQDGITHLGKISHMRVDEELLSSEYWWYPCTFPENCSTLSLKAQAARCLPVIIPSGGLDETVRYGLKTSTNLWTQGQFKSGHVQNAIQEWKELAMKVLTEDIQIYKDILEANHRKILKEYTYSGICHKFVERFL